MSGSWRLAWRSLAYHKIRTSILILCIALTTALPIAVQGLILRYEESLIARADATPLVVGAPGSRFDLLLHALYFRGELARDLSLADAEEIGGSGLATAIPVRQKHTARKFPLVGTSLDYFTFRGLTTAEGTFPQLLGDAVVGAEVARRLEIDLSSGDPAKILSDSGTLYNIGASYPLQMTVVGVLAPSGTPDDRAVFVDVRTAWVVEGLGHGHESIDENVDPALVLTQEEGRVTANAAVREYNKIDDTNRDSFHFHGGPETWPVSAIIVDPPDQKSRTILSARLKADERFEPIVPRTVLDETFDLVFRVKRFFDANTILVSVATALFLALIVALSWKIRERERETLFKIGAGRRLIIEWTAIELGTIVVCGAALAGGFVWIAIVAIGARWGL